MQLAEEISKRYENRVQQGLLFATVFCFASAVTFLVTQVDHLFPGGAPLLTYHRQAMNNFLYGADFTVLQTMDNNGENNVFFMTPDHTAPNDGLTILKANSVSAIRLSLFNDPSNTVQYGSLDEVTKLAARAKLKNFQILLELHFSDNFTSNATQSKPQAWKTFTGRKLAEAVHDWTRSVMKTLNDAKALPDIVSIGHEIENGILFTDSKQNCIMVGGYVGSPYCREKNMAYFSKLLRSAIGGIRSVSHRPRIMLHTSLANLLFLGRNGADEVIKFYSELNEKQKVAFDIIGLTFYPALAQGCDVSKLQEIKYIYEYFDGRFPIIIAETSFPLTDPQFGFNVSYDYSENGQYLFLRDLLETCRDQLEGMCVGVFWNPAYVMNISQLQPWQGPLFNLTEQIPLQVLTEGFLHE